MTTVLILTGCSDTNQIADSQETTMPKSERQTTTTITSTTAIVTITETTTICEHEWTEATCISKSTCRKCGLETGSFGEHNWEEATCTESKYCVTCGKKEGSPLGHEYVNGKCSRCGTADPNYMDLSMVSNGSDFVDYLNKNYSTWDTPFGKLTDLSYSVDENFNAKMRTVMPYDYYVKTKTSFIIQNPDINVSGMAANVAFLPMDIQNVNLTSEQVENTNKALESLQLSIANDAIAAFPGKKIAGGFNDTWSGGWAHVNDGLDPNDWSYYSDGGYAYFTWCNYSGTMALAGAYEESYLSELHWDSTLDDSWNR